MKTVCSWLLVFLVSLSMGHGVLAQDSEKDLAKKLKEVFEKNLKATEDEDMDAVLETLHSDSPAMQSSETMLEQIFGTYELKYTLVSYRFVCQDGDYAIARVEQETTKVRGPLFRDNRLDTYQVFRKEGERWKVWQTTVLEIEFLNE